MKKTNGAGYTIVELMIVVAVTAVTAVAAFAVVGSQRSRNEFSQAVRDFETKLTDVANDVAKGYYPNLGNIPECLAPNNAGISWGAPNTGQGSSSNCVFAGKAIEFNPSGDSTRMNLITIAARRRTRDNKNVTSLSDLATDDISAVPGLDEPLTLLYGLRLRSIRFNNSTNAYLSVVFLSGFANRPTDTSNLSGAPVTDLYGLSNSGSCTTIGAAIARPTCYLAPNFSLPLDHQGAVLCMEYGVGGRRARITLGKEGRLLTTSSLIASSESDIVCD